LALVNGGGVLDRSIDNILEASVGTPFIFNLGHGILQTTPTENVAHLVTRVHGQAGETS
jgi:uroporphyrinogen decarboxylase